MSRTWVKPCFLLFSLIIPVQIDIVAYLCIFLKIMWYFEYKNNLWVTCIIKCKSEELVCMNSYTLTQVWHDTTHRHTENFESYIQNSYVTAESVATNATQFEDRCIHVSLGKTKVLTWEALFSALKSWLESFLVLITMVQLQESSKKQFVHESVNRRATIYSKV